jgi:Auxiliary Activity family 9 (formerly GH61)
MYMAKAPGSVVNWNGAGNVWFKIFEEGGKVDSTGIHFHTGTTRSTHYMTYKLTNAGLSSVNARIPRGVPNGEYLVRVEHVALHKPGQPQFYVACGQVRVSGGGGGSPGPKVAFPGVYSKSSPSFTYNMYSGGM